MRFKLFSPPKLSGRFLHEADGPLTTGHLTRGPWVEKLRTALADKFNWTEDRIVLGSSATTCFRAVCLYLRFHHDIQGARFHGDEPWPLLPDEADAAFGTYPDQGDLHVFTEIGGAADLGDWTPPGPTLVDACHSWVVRELENLTLVSFYPTKLVPGAEGGAVFCLDPKEAEGIQRVLDCGFSSDSWAEVAKGHGRTGVQTFPAHERGRGLPVCGAREGAARQTVSVPDAEQGPGPCDSGAGGGRDAGDEELSTFAVGDPSVSFQAQ